MSLPDPETPATPDDGRFDGVSHGYAPEGRPTSPSPPPLGVIIGDVVDNVSATVKAEMALLQARGELIGHGVKWASVWGFVALGALLVALLALAFGAILVLAPLVGPLAATLIVVAALLAIAAFAGWRASRSAGDIRTALRSDLVREGEEEED